MSDVRNLTPIFATEGEVPPKQWKLVGDGSHCTFCGSDKVEATLGCPDDKGPVIWQIGVCSACIADSIMARFAEVKRQRLTRFAYDMRDAANEIREARERASKERYDRGFERLMSHIEPKYDPEAEAEAARRLSDEEEAIARRYDMPPGWSYDEFEQDMKRQWRERKARG
jgi:hypothetical protein